MLERHAGCARPNLAWRNRRGQRGSRARRGIEGGTMELRTLRYFVTVVREGSITAAAKSLHVTQPTLSRQLAALEDELGHLLVATHKESRYTVATHSFCQFTDKTGCLIMVHRVVYTVTIEDNEVIIDILDLLTQRSEGLRMLMQVIKDNGSKRVCIRCRKCKLTEGRLRRIAEHLFIRLIKQNFL